jgi:hypothetical protein
MNLSEANALKVRLFGELTQLQARLFDLVWRAGDTGIPSVMLSDILEKHPGAIKVHIFNLNQRLRRVGYEIRTTSLRYGYILTKLKPGNTKHEQQSASHHQR